MPKYIFLKFNILLFVCGIILGINLQKYKGIGNIIHDFKGLLYQREYILTRKTNVEIPQRFQGKISIFVLVGQSNMSGRGRFLGKAKANDDIFLFGNDYHWRVAVEPLDSPRNQVDKISQDSWVGVGLGHAFAEHLAKYSAVDAIGLIPCAKGNTSIEEWQRNLSENSLYGSCLKRIRAAMPMGKVEAILWFQGESDAVSAQSQPSDSARSLFWKKNFESLVENWRADLYDLDLPIVFAQLGRHNDSNKFRNWEFIQAQQKLVRIHGVTMIKTDDLVLKDSVHFTTESYEKIGKRFADAYLELIR